jgi:hypothetical protein
MGLTYEMLALVQCLLYAARPVDRANPPAFVLRLERIEAYLIERYNRD